MERYNTKIKGSTNSIITCNTILIYNSNNTSTPSLTLLNLGEVTESLLSIIGEYCLKLTKSDDGYFIYKNSSFGFNTIIYLDKNEKPVGFTKFLSIQGGEGRQVNIKLEFSPKSENDLSISVSTSYTEVEEKNLVGTLPYQYTPAGTIRSWTHTPELPYTYEVEAGKPILSDFNVVTEEGKIYKFLPIKSININEFRVSWFSSAKFSIGISIDDNLSILVWSGKNYYIISISSTNYFGNIKYLTGLNTDGYMTLDTEDNVEISEISGPYIYTTGGTLFYGKTGKQVTGMMSNFGYYYDEDRTELMKYPISNGFVSLSNISSYIPELNGINSNLSIRGIHKKGGWYILELYGGDVIFWGPHFSKRVGADEKSYYHILNSRALLYSKDKTITIFSEGEKVETEKIDLTKNLLDEFQGSYLLRKYRRGIAPDSLNEFTVVDTFGGFIFYKDGSILNYL